jgi:hypothetical protein
MDDNLAGWSPEDFYAELIIVAQDHAPLLGAPRLARITAAALDACIPDAPGRLWGYIVLPSAIRLIIGPTDRDALDTFADRVKARAYADLLDAILRADDDSLAAVLHYNPVWGGAIYQVWQPGYHCREFYSEYKLSNALYEMLQLPVEMALVSDAHQWPYTWIGGDDG